MEIIKNNKFGEVRTVQVKKEPWFVAKDVCYILGLNNRSMAVDKLDEDEKGFKSIITPGGTQDLIIINESGLYNLIFRSSKPEAKLFRKWVTSEVLPSIRKYGFYSTNQHRIDRAEKRLETKAVKAMLLELSSNLSLSDIGIVSKRCRVTERHVSNVLRGVVTDVYLLTQLHARVLGNMELKEMYYSLEGSKKLLQKLTNKNK